MLRFLLISFLFFPLLASAGSKAFVWLDLGDVIVETRNGYEKMHYMPGAVEYVNELKLRGHSVGLIVNIPESWGQPEDYNSKINELLVFLKKGWIDQEHPFTLAPFDQVLIPFFDRQRKPAPDLFVMALEVSNKRNLRPIFQSENVEEVNSAKTVGFTTHLVTFSGPQAHYLAFEELDK